MSEIQGSTAEKVVARQRTCAGCGRPYRPLPAKIIQQTLDEGRTSAGLLSLCPQCRRRKVAENIRLKG